MLFIWKIVVPHVGQILPFLRHFIRLAKPICVNNPHRCGQTPSLGTQTLPTSQHCKQVFQNPFVPLHVQTDHCQQLLGVVRPEGKEPFHSFLRKDVPNTKSKELYLWLLVFILVKKKNPLFHLKKMCTQGLRCNQVKDFGSRRTSSGETFGNC